MNKKEKFIIGTSGWSYPDWRGIFYPNDLPRNKWFAFYAAQFNAIEMNATFYRFFPKKILKKWSDQAPDNFIYIMKVHRLITHRKFLLKTKTLIKKFCRLAALLEPKLGLILLQIAPSTPYDPERLRKALLAFDDPKKVVVEFRHEKWLTLEIKQLLSQLGCIFCIADSPKIKLKDWLSSDTAYIRLHGRKKWYDYNYSKRELKQIANFAKKLNKKGATKIYIFFNNDYEAYAVKNALYLRSLLLNNNKN